jgi:hypothetical protein
MKKRFILCLIAFCLATSWAMAQTTNAKSERGTATAGADLLVGSLFFKEEPKTATVVGVNLWTRLGCLERRLWCWIIETDIWWRGPIGDPWRDIFPVVVVPTRPPTGPWDKFDISQVELGRALVVSPSLGLQFGGEKFKGSIFGGGGFQYTYGAESTIGGQKFRTTGGTAPLLSYGATARYFLKNNLSVRGQVGAMRVFEKDFNIIGPDGSVGIFEGMASTVPMVAVGVGFGLR